MTIAVRKVTGVLPSAFGASKNLLKPRQITQISLLLFTADLPFFFLQRSKNPIVDSFSRFCAKEESCYPSNQTASYSADKAENRDSNNLFWCSYLWSHLPVFGTAAPPFLSIFQELFQLFRPLFSRFYAPFFQMRFRMIPAHPK